MNATEKNVPALYLLCTCFVPAFTDNVPTLHTLYLNYRYNKKETGKPDGADTNIKSEKPDRLDIKPAQSQTKAGTKPDRQQEIKKE